MAIMGLASIIYSLYLLGVINRRTELIATNDESHVSVNLHLSKALYLACVLISIVSSLLLIVVGLKTRREMKLNIQRIEDIERSGNDYKKAQFNSRQTELVI